MRRAWGSPVSPTSSGRPARGNGAVIADARSYAVEGELPYATIVSWLRTGALPGAFDGLATDRAEIGRLTPDLASVSEELAALVEQLPEGEQRLRLWQAVTRALMGSSRPTLLIADDLHWADRETAQCLHYLLRVSAPDASHGAEVATAGLLIVATARSGDIDPDSPLANLIRGSRAIDRLTEIDLEPLSRADTAVLAGRLTGTAIDESTASGSGGIPRATRCSSWSRCGPAGPMPPASARRCKRSSSPGSPS